MVAEHHSRGDRIGYFRTGETTRHWEGHTRTPPRAGDVIVADMESGYRAIFPIIEVKRMSDPPDQWFATTTRDGWTDDESV
ncbi:hypothetical protein SEA_RABINOVISH_5 [Mycobacterium phage Rabinovish]|nr:hypothetical protein SEA_RABINOVISH_5 [Mycobacterium phage Rabinovish]